MEIGGKDDREDVNDLKNKYEILKNFVFDKDCGGFELAINNLVAFVGKKQPDPELAAKFEYYAKKLKDAYDEKKRKVAVDIKSIEELAAWGNFALREQEKGLGLPSNPEERLAA